jgi:simple sugar transport system permease protein
LLVGAQKLQREIQVSSSLITGINGLVVVFVVSSQIFIKRRVKRRVTAASSANEEHDNANSAG